MADLEPGQIRRILRDLDDTLELAGFVRLVGGSNDTYRIDLAGSKGPLLLKIYRDEPAFFVEKEPLVAGWIGEQASIAIPRWLRIDERRAVIPHRFALMTWLPGVTVRSLIGQHDIDTVYRQMGELLKRLHAIPMSAYGYIVDDGILRPCRTNAEYMEAAFEQAFSKFRERGADADFARRLEQRAQSRFDLLRYSGGPVLCHNDFQQGNVLAARDDAGNLCLTGLIDFGSALAGDALSDLAKALFCCAHEDFRSREPLLAGYGGIDHPDPAGALWLYTLCHRVIMWNHLKAPDILRDLDEMSL
jgi:Ser/Thr protein kinase RdoA (MazF antagonist)